MSVLSFKPHKQANENRNENRQARTEKLKEEVRDKRGGRILIKINSSCEILKKMSKKNGAKEGAKHKNVSYLQRNIQEYQGRYSRKKGRQGNNKANNLWKTFDTDIKN